MFYIEYQPNGIILCKMLHNLHNKTIVCATFIFDKPLCGINIVWR